MKLIAENGKLATLPPLRPKHMTKRIILFVGAAVLPAAVYAAGPGTQAGLARVLEMPKLFPLDHVFFSSVFKSCVLGLHVLGPDSKAQPS